MMKETYRTGAYVNDSQRDEVEEIMMRCIASVLERKRSNDYTLYEEVEGQHRDK